jgi:hypothetical protein
VPRGEGVELALLDGEALLGGLQSIKAFAHPVNQADHGRRGSRARGVEPGGGRARCQRREHRACEIVFQPQLDAGVALGQELGLRSRIRQQPRLDQLAARHADLPQPCSQLAVVEQCDPHRRFDVERCREQPLGFARSDWIDVPIGHGGQALDGSGSTHVAHVVGDRRRDTRRQQANAQPARRIAPRRARATSEHRASPEPSRSAGRCPADQPRRRGASGRRNERQRPRARDRSRRAGRRLEPHHLARRHREQQGRAPNDRERPPRTGRAAPPSPMRPRRAAAAGRRGRA